MNGQLEPYRQLATNGRRWDWLTNYRIRCVTGHHIPDLLSVDESGYVRCNKPIGDSRDRGQLQPPCGRWTFILLFRGGGHLLVEVTEAERGILRNMSTPTERVDYLGIFKRGAA